MKRPQGTSLFPVTPPIDLSNRTSRPVVSVACPKCQAGRGELCVNPSGKYAAKVHADRLRELNRFRP